MISLNCPALVELNVSNPPPKTSPQYSIQDVKPRLWSDKISWKKTLNNCRLILQPKHSFWVTLGLVGDLGFECFGVEDHGAKFVESEGFSVESVTFLGKDDGSGGVEFDGDRDRRIYYR